MTTKQEIQGNWDTIVRYIGETYHQISDQELHQVNRDGDQLIELIQRKTGQSRQQVEAFLDQCAQAAESAAERTQQHAESHQDDGQGAPMNEMLRERYEQVSDQALRGYVYSVKTVSRHPMESVLTALGVGLITGIAIGYSAAARRPQPITWRDRWMW